MSSPIDAELRQLIKDEYLKGNKEVKQMVRSEYQKGWRAANGDRVAKHRANYKAHPMTKHSKRRGYFLNKFGLTLEDYQKMKQEQNNQCGLCGYTLSDEYAKCRVDHDHRTGKIRSIVCCKCNNGLGMFADDIALLEKAIAYIKRHREIAL
jgi:hypothetical protein